MNQKLNDEIVEDEFDVVGKNVANKLRKLSTDMATITEKFIMDILFEAQLGNINRHSKLNISQTVQQQPSIFTTRPVQNNVQDTASFTRAFFPNTTLTILSYIINYIITNYTIKTISNKVNGNFLPNL